MEHGGYVRPEDYARTPGYERYARVKPTFSPRRGEIWRLDSHRLAVGDSGDPAVIEALLQGHQADLLLTDPPYGVNVADITMRRLRRDNARDGAQRALSRPSVLTGDELLDTVEVLLEGFACASKALKPGGAFYVFASTQHGYLSDRMLRNAGLPVRHRLIWVKSMSVLSRSDYHYRHEMILYGWQPGAPRYYVRESGVDSVFGQPRVRKNSTRAELLAEIDRLRALLNGYSDTQEWPAPPVQLYHPTSKPVPLLEGFVRRSARPGERVLDSYAGSGTTLLACQAQGRLGYGVEIDPVFAAYALQRYRDAHPEAVIERVEG